MKRVEKLAYAILALVLVALLVAKFSKSGYQLLPQDLTITSKGNPDSSIFDLKNDLACVPGPQDTAASYTKSLTPGGLCGDQQWVAQQADYAIVDGIGSSLLS